MAFELRQSGSNFLHLRIRWIVCGNKHNFGVWKDEVIWQENGTTPCYATPASHGRTPSHFPNMVHIFRNDQSASHPLIDGLME